MKKSNSTIHPRHYFNHIEYTPWPLYISIWTGLLVFFLLLYINKYESVRPYILLLVFLGLLFQIENWNKDIIVESTYLGRYNKKIYATLTIGFFLFLVSEIMLFSGFFWAYFDRVFFLNAFIDNISRLSPSSHPWVIVDWYRLPVVGTLFLVTSGYICNFGYYSFRLGIKDSSISSLVLGIALGVIFLCIQEFEYLEFALTMSDGVFASLFFLLTGFHGAHVLVGLIMLCTQLDRLWKNEYTPQRSTGLSFAIIYWHFVDIIWIFLFIFVYWFNNTKSTNIITTLNYYSYFF